MPSLAPGEAEGLATATATATTGFIKYRTSFEMAAASEVDGGGSGGMHLFSFVNEVPVKKSQLGLFSGHGNANPAATALTLHSEPTKGVWVCI